MLSNNVKIVQNGRFANVFIDGIQVRGVVSIDYHIDMKSIGTVKLEFFSQDIEIEINEVVPKTPEEMLEIVKKLNDDMGGTVHER